MICIIGAMEEEVLALKALSSNPQDFIFEDIETTLCDIEGRKILIAKSGIGKANAAYTATVLCLHFHPSFVINIGSAGGLLEGQDIGDIVVADCCRYHDLDIGEKTNEDPRFAYYPTPSVIDELETLLKEQAVPYHKGLMVTGDQFIQKKGQSYIHLKAWFPNAVCAEMEAGAIASVCSRRKIPFVIVRSISDLIFREGNEVDFDKYLPVASKKSAQLCKSLITRMF